MRQRLTNEHPVEGITMQGGQGAPLRHGGFVQNQRGDEMFVALQRNKLRRRLRQGKFAKAVLEGNFPKRNDAQENLILRIARGGGNGGG